MRNLVTSTLKVLSSGILSNAIIFAGVAYFAGTIGATDLGKFFLFQASITLLSIPADLGISTAIEKRVSEFETSTSMITTGILMKIPIIVLLSLLLYLLSAPINAYLGGNLARYLVVAVITQQTSEFILRVQTGNLHFELTAIMRFVRKTSWVGIGALLNLFGFGYRGLVYGLIVGYVLATCLGVGIAPPSFGRPSLTDAKSLFDFGKFSIISAVSGKFYTWADVLLLGFFVTPSAVGVYEVVWKVSASVGILSVAIRTVVFPQMSSLDSDGDTERIKRLVYNALLPSFLIVLPTLFGAMVVGDSILAVVFGEEFASAWPVLVLLFAVNFLWSFDQVFNTALLAINQPILSAKGIVVTLVLNVVLNVGLISEYGILGAAVATLMSFGTGTYLHSRDLISQISFEFPRYEATYALLASLAMALVLLPLKYSVDPTNPVLLSLLIVGGAIVFYGIVFAIPGYRILLVAIYNSTFGN